VARRRLAVKGVRRAFARLRSSRAKALGNVRRCATWFDDQQQTKFRFVLFCFVVVVVVFFLATNN
jgi:hypothetical protein